MGKNGKKKAIWASLLILVVVSAVIAVVVILFNGSTTGDVMVSSSNIMTGVKCIDTELMHPVFADVQPVSHANTITANFVGGDLSSIMYRYDGVYQSEDEASHARVLAEADYNLILANDYGEKIDIFTHSFMADGAKISLTVSSNANKITSKTAPYFLLDRTDSFPKTLNGLKAAYEAKGLSCKVEDKK